jgi:glutamine synthetase
VPTSQIFGENIFSLAVMQKRLPKDIYKSVKKTIESGTKLDLTRPTPSRAEMKSWAWRRARRTTPTFSIPLPA